MKERALSFIQPTGGGQLHIGNYFGAIKHWVRLQDIFDCIYGVVDYHAMTIDFDPATLRRDSIDVATDLIACGIDPKRTIITLQSHVPEHVELCWILNCVASYGDLQRMTQFKDKRQEQEFVSVGLFDYPVLMAADILLYRPAAVPVGKDQDQHLELTRDIAAKFNHRFGEFFPLPATGEALRRKLDLKGAKIVSLADPTRKMSKSLGSKHYIGVNEGEKSIRKKIRSAVTDTGPVGREDISPGVENLFAILDLSASQDLVKDFWGRYHDGTLKYVELKDAVYENLMKELEPIRQRKRELVQDPDWVENVLREGADRAQEIARETMSEVRRLVGVGRF